MRVTAFLRLASDDRLVELLRGGSDTAFEVLFDRYHRKLLAFCRQMVGSTEEAEDVVQHTFLAAYRELPASGRPIAVRPWLYAVARNRCLSVLRMRGRRPAGEAGGEPASEHLSAAVERREELRDLLGDLAELPDDQRAALVLAELGDVSYPEIAQVLDCHRDKVKALVFQARTSLIAARAARETPCAEVRVQLANLRGSALRRAELRRHLGACAGCREFRDEVKAQRRALALVLPVVPAVGLKAAVLGAAGTAAAGGGGATVAATAVVAVTLAAGGAAGVEAIRDEPPPRVEPKVRQVAQPAGAATAARPLLASGAAKTAAPLDGRAGGESSRGRAVGRSGAKGHGRANGRGRGAGRGRVHGRAHGHGRGAGRDRVNGRAIGHGRGNGRGRAVGPPASPPGHGRRSTTRPGAGNPSAVAPGRAVGPPATPPASQSPGAPSRGRKVGPPATPPGQAAKPASPPGHGPKPGRGPKP